MTRFFFSLSKDNDLSVDTEGTELPDLATAKREAERSLRELLADAIKSGDSALPDGLVVHNERGTEVHSVLMRDIISHFLRT